MTIYEQCPLGGGKVCPVCSLSDYDPITGQYDGIIRVFCGHLTGADTTINGFDRCIQEIPRYKRRLVQKKKDRAVRAKRLMLRM